MVKTKVKETRLLFPPLNPRLETGLLIKISAKTHQSKIETGFLFPALKIDAQGCTGEGNHIPNVAHSGHKLD
jgi:hypothetical protein